MTTTPIQFALQQILNCPYQGLIKRIHLESKALEAIALRLKQILKNDLTPNLPVELRPDDLVVSQKQVGGKVGKPKT